MFGRAPAILASIVLALVGGALSASAASARELVALDAPLPRGAILVRTGERRLYLALGNGAAISYRVAVGKPGKQWFGTRHVDGLHVAPAWSPPWEVKRDNARLPDLIPGGAPGNPMGAAALTLTGGAYAIHGTNRPESVGQAASYGCFRMRNDDVLDLLARVTLGTPVTVTR